MPHGRYVLLYLVLVVISAWFQTL